MQCDQSGSERMPAEFIQSRITVNQFAQGVIEFQQFVNRDAAPVARLMALLATFAPEEFCRPIGSQRIQNPGLGLVFFLAMFADYPHQSLRDNPGERVIHEERFDPNIN